MRAASAAAAGDGGFGDGGGGGGQCGGDAGGDVERGDIGEVYGLRVVFVTSLFFSFFLSVRWATDAWFRHW